MYIQDFNQKFKIPLKIQKKLNVISNNFDIGF